MSALIVKSPKPRNPWVAAALKRRAGRHAESGGARRIAERQALKKEVTALDLSRSPRGKPPSF